MPATMTYTVVEDSAAAAQAAVGEDVEELSFWDAAGSGTPPSGGSALLSVSISNNPAALTLAAMLQLAANEFVYTQNESAGETNFLSERKCEGVVSGGIWIQFHDGAAGTAKTANVMTLPRVQMEAANFSIARS